jgi:hypothetical protein
MADKVRSIPLPYPDAEDTYSLAEVAKKFGGEHKVAAITVTAGSDVFLARALDTFGNNPSKDNTTLIGGCSQRWRLGS